MFKKKVGRPTNRSKKIKRNLRLFGLLIVVGALTTMVLSLSDYSKNNIGKLKGDIYSFTDSDGVTYTCNKSEGWRINETNTTTCIKDEKGTKDHSCKVSLNGDSSYEGYSWNKSSGYCEKKYKYEESILQTYTTASACKNGANGISTGNAKCIKCKNGSKPIKQKDKYVCVPTSCSSGTYEKRSDGCYAQKKTKQYYYCGSDRNNTNYQNPTCSQTKPADVKKGTIKYKNVNCTSDNINYTLETTTGKIVKCERSSSATNWEACANDWKSTSSVKVSSLYGYKYRYTHENGTATVVDLNSICSNIKKYNLQIANNSSTNTTSNKSNTSSTQTTSNNSSTSSNSKKYTITYHANGGTGENWTDTVTYGTNYKTYKNWYSRSGYTFVGWNESPDGKGVDWTDWINKDWKWTYTKNVDLYAQWKVNKYTITYHANGGTGKDYTDTVTYGTNYVTWDNWYTRNGYKFIGWNEKQNGKGVSWTDWINKDWKWTYTKNVDLYAQWQKDANAQSTTAYGWKNNKFYNKGVALINTYVEVGAQNGHYAYIDEKGSINYNKQFIWLSGTGKDDGKWWFAQSDDRNNYISNKSVSICGYSSSRRSCKIYKFDSSGWNDGSSIKPSVHYDNIVYNNDKTFSLHLDGRINNVQKTADIIKIEGRNSDKDKWTDLKCKQASDLKINTKYYELRVTTITGDTTIISLKKYIPTSTKQTTTQKSNSTTQKTTTQKSTIPTYGWHNNKFYSNSKMVVDAYVEISSQNGHYAYINSSGIADFNKQFIWLSGTGNDTGKWWFAQSNNRKNYVANKSVTVCGTASSRKKCKSFSFDSSGWCSTGNYKCGW